MSADCYLTVSARGKAREHSRIVPGYDQPRIGRECLDAILRLEVALGIERLRNRDVLLQILVQIDVVGREDRRARGQFYRDVLRRPRVLAARIAADAGNDLLVVAIDEAHTPL